MRLPARSFARPLFSRAPSRACVSLLFARFFRIHQRPTTKRRDSFVRWFTRSLARDCGCSCNRPPSSRPYIFQADSRPTGNVAISRSTKHNAALPPKTCLIFRQKRDLAALFVRLFAVRLFTSATDNHPSNPLNRLNRPDSTKPEEQIFNKVSYA